VDGVRVAAAVQQEVAVLHPGERQRLDVEAGVVEVRVERADLYGVLHVVARRAVAVVVGILGGAGYMSTGAGAARYRRVVRYGFASVLPRAHVEVAEHPHLHCSVASTWQWYMYVPASLAL